MKKLISKIAVAALLATPLLGVLPIAASADTVGPINFESPTYTIGNINGQDGWSALGSAGSGCGVYDEGVSSSFGTAGFGAQSFRLSDAVTSGCFGDQAFSKPLVNEAGETDALNGGMSGGVRQTHFEAQFDLASVLPLVQQPGMHMSVSPDRGDGARMSYLRFEDQVDGIHVFFDDVTDPTHATNADTFNESDIATITRAPHTIKFVMDFVDGPDNDVVGIYIDGALVKTGTSWEDYYRFDTESQGNPHDPSLENKSRTVDSLLFRESGDANPLDAGNGFLVDNVSLSSSTPPPTVPTIISPANNICVTSANQQLIDWTDSTGVFPPISYQYEAFGDAGYTSLIYNSGMTLTSSQIPTPGTPDGVYYVRVRAQDSHGNTSDWSNGPLNPFKIVVSDTFTWSQFLAPLNISGKTFNTGSTIPVKFQILDACGGSVQMGSATITITGTGYNHTFTATYDPVAKQYMYNWSTKTLQAQSYTVKVNALGGVSGTPPSTTVTLVK